MYGRVVFCVGVKTAICAGSLEDAYTGETTAQYVFRRLTSEGRQPELLTLPEIFNAELHAWLLRQANPLPSSEMAWN